VAFGPVAPAVVIDTNAWLDLYLFHDAGAQALAQALDCGAVRAVASAATQAELHAVLLRPLLLARFAPDEVQAGLRAWSAIAQIVHDGGAAPWSCRDPDDQKFLDLAYAQGARWLFTKDRALLALARKARRAGLYIAPPSDFANAAGTMGPQ